VKQFPSTGSPAADAVSAATAPEGPHPASHDKSHYHAEVAAGMAAPGVHRHSAPAGAERAA
jgi:hypothetical protein